jgi:glycosyltransferase involved in cell wall biosynthesis
MRPTLGVVIPCTVNHVKYLDNLLRTTASSTVKPVRIVISCSSSPTERDVLLDMDGIPVEILYTTRTLNAAQNRNRGAARVATEIITFFDADDVMHPRRIEFLHAVLEARTDIDVLYHNYSYEPESARYDPFWTEDAWAIHPASMVKDPRAVGIMVRTDPPNQVAHHHAHVTVRSHVGSRFQFPEDARYARLEDSMYGALLVAHAVPMACLTNRLSRYIFRG